MILNLKFLKTVFLRLKKKNIRWDSEFKRNPAITLKSWKKDKDV